MAHTVTKIEFDPIEVKDGQFKMSGRVTLSNGEVRTISGGGPASDPGQELRSQRIMLRQVIDILMGGRA